jgi:sterol desaturase/sphingolipid hydroxylase (fatty acid hydroxylase superfamily)
VLVIPLMTLLSVGAATLIGGHAGWLELRPAAHWPGWLLVPLTIAAMDGANWLARYADHRLGALWRFRALHHSQEELSVLTSFRAHPLMHTTGFILATIPVVALMPDRPIAPVLITIYICVGTLQHANLRLTFGPLGRVLVSPAYHRLHHAPNRTSATPPRPGGRLFTFQYPVTGSSWPCSGSAWLVLTRRARTSTTVMLSRPLAFIAAAHNVLTAVTSSSA